MNYLSVMVLVYRPQIPKPGLGNLLMNLCSAKLRGTKFVHKDILDYEFGNCFTLNEFTIVDFDGEQPHCMGTISQEFHERVWPMCRSLMSPTHHLLDLVEQHKHVLEGVVLGVNIRRGAYSADSTQFPGVTDRKFFHCSDSGLDKFLKEIGNAPGRVYVSSDSSSTKQMIKDRFGSKVSMLDTVYAHTAEQTDPTTQTVKNLQDVYLVWYLLSMCPLILVTGGRPDFVGFSTFGYMAAHYGSKPCKIIFNED
jgi:hypothetical protein